MLKSRQINTDQPTPLLPSQSDSLGCAHAVHVSMTHQQDVENPENKHTPTHASVSAESRRDQKGGGELDSHEEFRHFCGFRRDQEEGGGAGPSS